MADTAKEIVENREQGNRLGQWMADFRWAMNMMRARRHRRGLTFSQRVAFDDAFRPQLPTMTLYTRKGVMRRDVIAYPDAAYHITIDDLIRAMLAAAGEPHA